ncbi:MAG: hypothetical protein LUI61_05970 [Firmicutes bacterium]|nr:hypothetical protein [Bacillota bacterium]
MKTTNRNLAALILSLALVMTFALSCTNSGTDGKVGVSSADTSANGESTTICQDSETTDEEQSSKIVYCSGDGIAASLSLDDEDEEGADAASNGTVLVVIVLETPSDMPEMDKSSLNINSTDEEVEAVRAAYREAMKEAISAVTDPFLTEYAISESAAGYSAYVAMYSPIVQLSFESTDGYAEYEEWILSFAEYETVVAIYIEA